MPSCAVRPALLLLGLLLAFAFPASAGHDPWALSERSENDDIEVRLVELAGADADAPERAIGRHARPPMSLATLGPWALAAVVGVVLVVASGLVRRPADPL